MNDTLVALIGHLSQTLGSLGGAILLLSLAVRVALLPLTIKLARRAQRNQEVMRALQPEIEQLKKQFEKKPERLLEEMNNLYRKHDLNPFDLRTMLGSFIQLPIFGLLYNSIRSSLGSAVSFAWIKSLASPNFLLTLVILFLTGLSAWLVPSTSGQMRNVMIAIQVTITFFFVWKLAAGLSLYWVSSSAVGLFQTLWLRYRTVNTSITTAN